FVGGETDQCYPALYRATTPVEAPRTPEEGYQLATDLAGDCVRRMRTQKALARARPVSVRFRPAASHRPPHPPLAWRGRNRGRFDMGWDRYREQVLRRQLELGVVPPGTRLTTRPDAIPAFDSFSDREQACLFRQAENFA